MKKNDYDIVCFFDGAVEPRNPGGHLGSGSIVMHKSSNKILLAHSYYREPKPENTNNVAEYLGLYHCLKWLTDYGYHKYSNVIVYGDSKMVIEQMCGRFNINDGKAYTDGAKICKEMVRMWKKEGKKIIALEWIPREQNIEADKLSTWELEKRGIFANRNKWKRK